MTRSFITIVYGNSWLKTNIFDGRDKSLRNFSSLIIFHNEQRKSYLKDMMWEFLN